MPAEPEHGLYGMGISPIFFLLRRRRPNSASIVLAALTSLPRRHSMSRAVALSKSMSGGGVVAAPKPSSNALPKLGNAAPVVKLNLPPVPQQAPSSQLSPLPSSGRKSMEPLPKLNGTPDPEQQPVAAAAAAASSSSGISGT